MRFLTLCLLLCACGPVEQLVVASSHNESTCPGWTFVPDDVVFVETLGLTADPRAAFGQRTAHLESWDEATKTVLVRAGDGWTVGGDQPVDRRPVGGSAWMTWEVRAKGAVVRDLVEATVDELRCEGPAPEGLQSDGAVGVAMGVTSRQASVEVHSLSDGRWLVARPDLGATWLASDDGYRAALDRWNEALSAPGKELWATWNGDCNLPISRSARPHRVDIRLNWSGLGPGSLSELELVGDGGHYVAQARQVKGRPTQARTWTATLGRDVVRPIVQLLSDGVRCGPAPRVRSHTDDYPRRRVELRFLDPPMSVALVSESQGRGGAPWAVSGRSGATYIQGARDDGAILDAISDLFTAAEAQAPAFAPAPEQRLRRR